MRSTLTIALSLAVLPLAANTPPPSAEVPVVAAELPLILKLAEQFQGKETADAMAAAVKQGASLKDTDIKGNTALIILASAVEGNIRYKADDTYRKALRDAIVYLMQNGADCLIENNAGCNALFFLHSDPELITKLLQLKLIPRELTIRVPHDEAALSRFMQLRLAQAGYSTNPFSLDYLKRRYCKPAYPRVMEQLLTYLSAETSSHIPAGAMQDTLAFLRMADEEASAAYINSLTLWEHGEHFLEEIPERLLVALRELQWEVEQQNLIKALSKLETMLPVEEGDMIDCYAAYPMGQILEIMLRQDAAATAGWLKKYTASPDPDMAYTAYRILLQQNKLPLPEPGPLCETFDLSQGMEALPADQKKILECALVDEAMRSENMKHINPEMIARVQDYFREMNLGTYADILGSICGENGIITPEEGLLEACTSYQETTGTHPRLELARFILAHPELFHKKES